MNAKYALVVTSLYMYGIFSLKGHFLIFRSSDQLVIYRPHFAWSRNSSRLHYVALKSLQYDFKDPILHAAIKFNAAYSSCINEIKYALYRI